MQCVILGPCRPMGCLSVDLVVLVMITLSLKNYVIFVIGGHNAVVLRLVLLLLPKKIE